MPAQEAAQMFALMAVVSTCTGIMHAWCMPATHSVDRPECAQRTYDQVARDLKERNCKWARRQWCLPVLKSDVWLAMPTSAGTAVAGRIRHQQHRH